MVSENHPPEQPGQPIRITHDDLPQDPLPVVLTEEHVDSFSPPPTGSVALEEPHIVILDDDNATAGQAVEPVMPSELSQRKEVIIPDIHETEVTEVIKQLGIEEGTASGIVHLVRVDRFRDPVVRKVARLGQELYVSREFRHSKEMMEKGVRRIAKVVGVHMGPVVYKEFVPTFRTFADFDNLEPASISGEKLPYAPGVIGRAHLAYELARTLAEIHGAGYVIGDQKLADLIPTVEKANDGRTWEFMVKVVDLGNSLDKSPEGYEENQNQEAELFFNYILEHGLNLPTIPKTQTQRKEWLEQIRALHPHSALMSTCERFTIPQQELRMDNRSPADGRELMERLMPYFESLGVDFLSRKWPRTIEPK